MNKGHNMKVWGARGGFGTKRDVEGLIRWISGKPSEIVGMTSSSEPVFWWRIALEPDFRMISDVERLLWKYSSQNYLI